MPQLSRLCPLLMALGLWLGIDTHPAETPELKRLKVDDAELAYVEEGAGDAVVFVHGASGDWRTWDFLRPLISKKYRYVALSRRYHFPNAWLDRGEKYSVMRHVEDLSGFIRALGVGRVHLVGASYGGRVAGYVALKHPELLRSVVLSEPGLIPPVTEEGKAARAEFLKDYAAALEVAKHGDVRRGAALLFDAVQGDEHAFEKASPDRQQRWLDNARTLVPMDAGADPPPVTCAELAGMKVPVLVMRGEQTRAAFRYGNERLLACLPKGTSTAVVPGAPHIWYAVNPRAGAEAILAFIAKH